MIFLRNFSNFPKFVNLSEIFMYLVWVFIPIISQNMCHSLKIRMLKMYVDKMWHGMKSDKNWS